MRKFAVHSPKGKLLAWGKAATIAKVLPKILAKVPRLSIYPASASKPAPAPAPKPITLFDSVNPSLIPADAEAVAGYVNGYWPTFSTLARSHPHAKRVSITVSVHADARVLDVECGDATPDQAPAWVKRQHEVIHTKRPGVYTFLAQAQTLVDDLAKAGIPRDQYVLWTAHWTGKPHLCDPGCGLGFRDHADATQWSDHAANENLDVSLCAPDFFQ